MKKNKCDFDCFNCKFADCISDSTKSPYEHEKSEESPRERKNRLNRESYRRHREQVIRKSLDYYYANKEKVLAKKKERYYARKGKEQVNSV